MRKIEFVKKEDSRAGKLYLEIEYMGGDADTEHFEEVLLPYNFADYANHLVDIEEIVAKYEIIKKVTDGGGGYQNWTWDKLNIEYGDEIADMYDNVPNDPQGDYQFKTSLHHIRLIGYNEKGDKFEAYIL